MTIFYLTVMWVVSKMAWIEAHQNLRDHPKVLDLVNLMEWDLDTTIGKLFRFWWWCVDYAEDGDLRKHNDNRLAVAVGLNGKDGERFVGSMVQSCWIDRKPYFRVHDWWDYFGRFLQVKYKNSPEKWRKIQELYQQKEGGSKGSSKNHIPNLTKPNQYPLEKAQKSSPKRIKSDVDYKKAIPEEEAKFTLSRTAVDGFFALTASQNKTGLITESRKLSLLCQLSAVLTVSDNETIFRDALNEMIGKGIDNTNYLKKIIESAKQKGIRYSQSPQPPEQRDPGMLKVIQEGKKKLEEEEANENRS